MSRQLQLGRWDVHLVASQNAVGVFFGPEVVILRRGFLGSAGLNPAHFNGMNQLPNLKAERRIQWRDRNTSLRRLRAHVGRHYRKHSLHTSTLHTLHTGISKKRPLGLSPNVCRSDFFQCSISDAPLRRRFRPFSTLKTMWDSLFVRRHSWEQLGDQTGLFLMPFPTVNRSEESGLAFSFSISEGMKLRLS